MKELHEALVKLEVFHNRMISLRWGIELMERELREHKDEYHPEEKHKSCESCGKGLQGGKPVMFSHVPDGHDLRAP